MTNELINRVKRAKAAVDERFSGTIDSAVLLGSGLSKLRMHDYEVVEEIEYADIVGLPISTAPTHRGTLSLLSNGDRTIAVGAGRHHLYEGYSAHDISVLPYLLRSLGAEKFFVTNAAGSLNPALAPSSVMLIEDHINATGHNPLIGQSVSLHVSTDSLGSAFPDMSNAYTEALQGEAKQAASRLGCELHSGVYLGVTGPSLETSAERRMMRSWGGDAVGMSTVTEVIAAVHCGMQVVGLSAITNMALGGSDQQADDIDQILANAAIAGQTIEKILGAII